MSKKAQNFKIATVAILGRPNAGKSTLLNALLETAVSPTSNRPQTTRHNIRGIIQLEEGKGPRKVWTGQIVLIDTPGINLKKGQPLERSMLMAVEDAVMDVDVVIWVGDSRTFSTDLRDLELEKAGTDKAMGWLRDQLKKTAKIKAAAAKGEKGADQVKTPKWVLVLSKSDLVSKPELLPLMEKAHKILPDITEIVPVAAKLGIESKNSNLDSLLEVLKEAAPEGEPMYEEESWTDLSERQLVQNLVREAIFQMSHDEVPYESDCSVLRWVEPTGKKKMAEVEAAIWVGKRSLKPILVGKNGGLIKEINFQVRQRYKEITGEDIVLRMVVKVVDKWTSKPANLLELGYVSSK